MLSPSTDTAFTPSELFAVISVFKLFNSFSISFILASFAAYFSGAKYLPCPPTFSNH